MPFPDLGLDARARDSINPSQEEKCGCTSIRAECNGQQLACRARGTAAPKCGRGRLSLLGGSEALRSQVWNGQKPEAKPRSARLPLRCTLGHGGKIIVDEAL